jgi:parallel beta-helix repeat protein
MVAQRKTDEVRVCPKTGRPIREVRRYGWVRWVFPLAGVVSLVWFLIRVVPKPSRAAYPCQRLAAPIAGSFVVWLVGIVGSSLAYRKARRLLGQSRYVVAGMLLMVAVAAIWMSLSATHQENASAAFVPSDPANSPMGIGKGIHPGRVVWMYEPRAAKWDGKTGAWWDEANTDQLAVDYMVSKSLRTFTGEPNNAASWDALFRYFNRTHRLGDVGYAKGEKIVIKINMNQDSGGTWSANAGMPSPQMLHSVVDQLVHVVGVPGDAITIYDAARYIGDPLYNKIRGDPDPNFQSVRFVCNTTRNGRIGATHDPANPIRFANPNVPGNARAYVPRCVTEAKYLINMALFRAHTLFGVTFCGKNLFGSIYWPNNGGWTPSPLHNFGSRDLAMGSYNCLVDLIGHPHLGGKTLLYMIDAVYGARNQSAEVMRFASFGEKWTSSIFISQDPVAIDSVALDFVRNESKATDCTGPGVDNYLHEAAMANDPPSGSLYDPDGDGRRLESLGVHEHWNNAADKKYSRNLGTGDGIELVIPALTSDNGPVRNLNKGTRYDLLSQAIQDANGSDVIVAAPGTYDETVDFHGKNLLLRSEDPNDPNVVAATIISGSAQAVVFSGGEDANCVFAGFTVTGAGQGIYCNAAMPTIVNCRIVDNGKAGIKLWEGSNPTIANCIIEGNGGAGIDLVASAVGRFVRFNGATISHCTIVGNRKEGVTDGKPVIVNSIIYLNGVGGQVPQISARDATVGYCDIEGGYAGIGNISADPCFVSAPYWADPTEPNLPAARDDPTAVWVSGDYHLRDNSPCIDAGDPGFVPVQTPNLASLLAVDIDGQPRRIGPSPDLGCDEVATQESELVPGP